MTAWHWEKLKKSKKVWSAMHAEPGTRLCYLFSCWFLLCTNVGDDVFQLENLPNSQKDHKGHSSRVDACQRCWRWSNRARNSQRWRSLCVFSLSFCNKPSTAFISLTSRPHKYSKSKKHNKWILQVSLRGRHCPSTDVNWFETMLNSTCWKWSGTKGFGQSRRRWRNHSKQVPNLMQQWVRY